MKQLIIYGASYDKLIKESLRVLIGGVTDRLLNLRLNNMPNNSLLSDEILELQRKKKRDEESLIKLKQQEEDRERYNKMRGIDQDDDLIATTDHSEDYRFYTSQETF
jgi:hypothetical protein